MPGPSVRFAPVSATRFPARWSDSKVPASVHHPSRISASELPAAQVPVVHVGDLELAPRSTAGACGRCRTPARRTGRRRSRRRGSSVAPASRRSPSPARCGSWRRRSAPRRAPPSGGCAPPRCWRRKRETAAADAALDDVVAEDHADAVAVGEVLGELERRGDAALALLVGVVEALRARTRGRCRADGGSRPRAGRRSPAGCR